METAVTASYCTTVWTFTGNIAPSPTGRREAASKSLTGLGKW